MRRPGIGSELVRRTGLLGVVWLLSLGAASSAGAAACAWNPVCPYQGVQVLGSINSASLDGPLAVAMTPSGDLVIADKAKNSVREFTAMGQFVRQIGTPGSYVNLNGLAVDPSSGEIWVSDNMGVHGYTADGTTEATAGGNGVGPYQTDGIAVSPGGTLYVFNGDTNTIYEYSPNGTILAMLPGLNLVPANTALPTTLAVDAQGDIYIGVVDFSGVKEFNSAGTQVATIPVPPVQSIAIYGSVLYAQLGSGSGAGIGTYSLSGNPQGGFSNSQLAGALDGSTFAVGSSGIEAVTTDHTIQHLGFDGTAIANWGGLANDDFQASGALADSAGNIFVMDAANARVIRYDAQGDPPNVFADLSAYGTPGLASIDSVGDLVIATSGDTVTLDANGGVISAVGNSATAPDGTPWSSVPSGNNYWASDSSGNVYVDFFHGTAAVPIGYIGKYSASGQLLGSFDASAAWGYAIPGPLAVDAHGRIYVATNTRDIREFDPSGKLIAVWPSSSSAGSISVAANGDVYASTGATVTRFYAFVDPLPPVPPVRDSPWVKSLEASISLILARQSMGALSTTIDCTGSPGVSCAGTLVLSAKIRARKPHSKHMTTRLMLLGTKTFSIPAGQRAPEIVTLNRAARVLLRTRARLDATLTASYQAGTHTSTVIRKVVLRGHSRKTRSRPHTPRR